MKHIFSPIKEFFGLKEKNIELSLKLSTWKDRAIRSEHKYREVEAYLYRTYIALGITHLEVSPKVNKEALNRIYTLIKDSYEDN